MLTYPMNGKQIHISDDGKLTVCGKACVDWWTERDLVDWNGMKSDCPRCGASADFQSQREQIAIGINDKAEREVAAEIKRKALSDARGAAMEKLGKRISDVLSAAGIATTETVLPGAVYLKTDIEIDGFLFAVDVHIPFRRL